MRHRDRDDFQQNQQQKSNGSFSNGHNYEQVGEPIDPVTSTLSESEIHNLIRERMQCRRAHKFDDADNVLKKLNRIGVQMDDKTKEWWASSRSVGVEFEAASQVRDAADNHKFGHDYKQIGEPIDPSTCKLTEGRIHTMIRERIQCRMSRDFDKADRMREELNSAGVQVDDDLREWRADGAGMRGRKPANEFGHDYTQVGGKIDAYRCKLTEEEIHGLIRERMECRMARGFHKADTILGELHDNGVDIDDKTKKWRADGVHLRDETPDGEDASPGTQSPVMKNFLSLEEAIEVSHDHLEKLTTRDISAFWAVIPQFLEQRNAGFASKNPQSAAQLGGILARTLEDINAFDYRDLTTTTLGLAKIVKNIESRDELADGGPHQMLHGILIGADSKNKQTIFRHIARSSVPSLDEFDARCLSNLPYAYAIAQFVPMLKDGSTLLDHLAKRTIPELGSFKPQGLSNMVWAYATLNAPNHALFEEASETIIDLLGWETFKPQDLSNIVSAYVKLDESDPMLFEKIADHIVGLDGLEAFSGRDCADILTAFATAEESHPKLFKKFANHIMKLDSLRQFKPQDLAAIASAYATAREPHPKLLKKFAGAVLRRKDEFNSQSLATFLWAYSTTGQIDQHLLSALSQTIASSLSKCTGQDLARIAWAYAVANASNPSPFIHDFMECLEEKDGFDTEGLCQLHQWNLWREEIKSDIKLPTSLQEKCWDAFLSRIPESSALQNDVIAELSSMDFEVKEKTLTQRGYWLDALIEVDGKKIGVQVDELTNLVGRKPTGNTILNRRQIANLEDTSVVSVPYWKWLQLGDDSDEKQQYLRNLLGLVSLDEE